MLRHSRPDDQTAVNNAKAETAILRLLSRWPGLWKLAQRLFRFGLVGASGFLLDMGVYTLLSTVIGVPHLIARGGSYWCAATWNWFWNRVFTFADAERARKIPQWGKYLSMCMVSFVPNWGTYYLLTSSVVFFEQYKILALIAGVGAGMLFNFTIASLFIFSSQSDAK